MNIAQKAAKEKKNRHSPHWASSQVSRAAKTSPQFSMGRKETSTMAVRTAAASRGRSIMLSPTRYWVVNRASRRMGRAWVQQAERWL